MSDIQIYMIANLIVTDKDEYHIYEKGFFRLLKKHKGSFITYDDNSETLEGSSPRNGRMIIISFPSEEAGKSWYEDAEYQALSEHRRAGSKMEFLTMVHGLPSRK